MNWLILVMVLWASSAWASGFSGGSGLPTVGNEGDCLLTSSGAWVPGACPGAGTGAPTTATYLTQTANGTLSAEQAIGSLATGCMSSTTTTGVVATRTLTGTANQITVTNGDCSANPVLSIPTNPTLPGTTTGTFSGNLTGTASVAATGDSATSFFSSGTIEDARLPSSMADKVFTGSILLPNGTSVPGTCSIGMLYFDNDATAGVNLYGCTASNTWTLLGDGSGSGAIATDTIWDAAGDLVYGTGSNTANRLAAGTANQLLRMNSGATAPEWTSSLTGLTSISTGSGGTAGLITVLEGTVCGAGTNAGEHNLCFDSSDSLLKSRENGGSLVTYYSSANLQTTAATASADDNDTSIATTAYVQTELTAYAADTVTLTNKTLNAESTGNVITLPRRYWLPAAGCNNATAGSVWDLPTSNPAVAACVTGTNTQKGVLDFADGANSLSAQLTIKLPSTWTGTVDANIKWFSATTTGDVVWQLATICVADAETDDPAFNTASTVTDTAKGTTNQTNDAAITGVTATGCAAGELMHVKIFRDPANGSDTHAATARLIGVELVIREAI